MAIEPDMQQPVQVQDHRWHNLISALLSIGVGAVAVLTTIALSAFNAWGEDAVVTGWVVFVPGVCGVIWAMTSGVYWLKYARCPRCWARLKDPRPVKGHSLDKNGEVDFSRRNPACYRYFTCQACRIRWRAYVPKYIGTGGIGGIGPPPR